MQNGIAISCEMRRTYQQKDSVNAPEVSMILQDYFE